METPQGQIDPGHESKRTALRVLGPALLVVGVILLLTGTVRMFSPAWQERPNPTAGFLEGRKSFDEVSRDMHREFAHDARTSFGGFGMVAAGMVCMVAGGVMTKMGYMGSVARYAAGELAPVGTDTINYVGRNAKDGVRDIAEAVSQGVRGPGGEHEVRAVRCAGCHALNEVAAKFCNQCGRAMGA